MFGRGNFDLAPTPYVRSRNPVPAKEGILDLAGENAHFQQHVWEYFALNIS